MVASPELEWHGLMAVSSSHPAMAGPHLHPEVELNLLVRGTAGYVTPRGFVALTPGRLTAFWGGLPHRLLGGDDVELLIVTVPLSAVIGQLALDGALRMLMQGHWLTGTDAEGGHDEFLLRRWIDDLGDAAAQSAAHPCQVELQGRLARLGAGFRAPEAARLWGGTNAADRLLVSIARTYTSAASVAELAEDAGVHPTYAAKIFKASFGMPLWEYVTHLRVAHAVRLLTGSDWSIDRIAYESGFHSRSSFYRAFGRLTGDAPSLLRRRERLRIFTERS
jgi:AraC-like DNA-binding protein